jgi:hypothetical protein
MLPVDSAASQNTPCRQLGPVNTSMIAALLPPREQCRRQQDHACLCHCSSCCHALPSRQKPLAALEGAVRQCARPICTGTCPICMVDTRYCVDLSPMTDEEVKHPWADLPNGSEENGLRDYRQQCGDHARVNGPQHSRDSSVSVDYR